MPRNKEFEREEVLEKALEVFWQYGYNGTSFQALTEGMCISRQSIYDTYGDKRTLFLESLRHYVDKNIEQRAALFNQQKPVREILKEFCKAPLAEIKKETTQKGCFLTNASLEMIPHDPEVKEIADKNIKALTKDLQVLIARGIKSGEIKTEHSAEVLAYYMVNTVNGLNTLGKTITDKKKLQAIVDVAIDALG